MTLRPVLLVALLQLLPTGAMAEELADVSPPVDLSVTPESARAQRMEKKLKPYVGKRVQDIFSAFGAWQDGYPNGDVFSFLWESSKAKTACRFWFDVDHQERVVDWHWRGDC
jgi:hypothetical protein